MISVVIPTLNEESLIGRCITAVESEPEDFEIIVADGGSSDETVAEAASFRDVSVVGSARGRGGQMNAGAAAARGEILLFLHADTVLEKGWSTALLSACEESGTVGGAFTFKIDWPGGRYRMTEHWVNLRCRLFRLPYGDQGIFIKRDVFEELGGYREIPVMEDVDIIERMNRLGRVVLLNKNSYVHARKWIREGWVRTSVRNQLIMLMYRLGADPHYLARIYYRGG